MKNPGPKNTFARNLNRLLRAREETQLTLSRAVGVSTSSVSAWCSGEKMPRMDKLDKIAAHFHVSRAELLTDDTRENITVLPKGAVPVRRIPVLGTIAAGSPVIAEENIIGYTYTDLNGGHEYFGLRVRGDSMNVAGIPDGSTVIVRRQNYCSSGDIAVVILDGQDATIKKILWTDEHHATLIPQSTNPVHQPVSVDIRRTPLVINGVAVKVEVSL
ncbi:MAG: helix-turn-helix domain-containing protein [Oscillospiraceae bacterium]|nr:helix-turn-helix domain-containing protein [Oscillospiraceae bacterium]